MDFWLAFLPIIIYILLIIILIIGIILGIKAIITVNKFEKVVDDIKAKVESLNGFFQVIDFTTDKIAMFTDRIFGGISMMAAKIFNRKNKLKKRKEE